MKYKLKKAVNPGPFYEGWSDKFTSWSWWENVLLLFKKAEWIGCGDVEYKVKSLLGNLYFLGEPLAFVKKGDLGEYVVVCL